MDDKPMITLQTLLEALKNKVDEDYADRIEKAVSMKSVDRLEAQAIEKIEMIEAVMRLAEQHYPTWADTDLVVLQLQGQAEPLIELIEVAEKALSVLYTDNDALGYGTEEEGQAAMELRTAINKVKGQVSR